MTLRHLKILVAVCEAKSATIAAEKLHIAQPSVSLAIAELESYYGVKLFDRIARRLHITETGKHFLQYATHIVRLFDDMEKEIKNFDSIGTIRIGASIAIGNHLLPDYIAAFKKKYPKMHVKVLVENSNTIEQCITENRLDVGLIEGIVHSPYLVQVPFMDDELVMICANEHPWAGMKEIDVNALAAEDVLLREQGSASREIFDSVMKANEIELIPTWESASTQAIIRGVMSNIGIAILPNLLVRHSLEQKKISSFTLKGLSFQRKLYLVYHKNKFITQSAHDFLTICQEI